MAQVPAQAAQADVQVALHVQGQPPQNQQQQAAQVDGQPIPDPQPQGAQNAQNAQDAHGAPAEVVSRSVLFNMFNPLTGLALVICSNLYWAKFSSVFSRSNHSFVSVRYVSVLGTGE